MSDKKIVLVKQNTTLNDDDTLKSLSRCVSLAIISILNQMKVKEESKVNKNSLFLEALVSEIYQRIHSEGIEHYNIFLGEDFSVAIRYEKASLATFRWNGIKILLFRCPANPIHSLEEDPLTIPKPDSNTEFNSCNRKEDLIKKAEVIKEYQKEKFTATTSYKVKELIAEVMSDYLTNSLVK